MSEIKPTPLPPCGARERLQACYERLWLASLPRIQAGNIELDSLLAARRSDHRRGLTLIARPSPAVRQRVAAFLGQLRQLEPEQHYYAPSELHLTVLSLFTATVKHARFFARKDRYIAAVDAALRKVAPIRVDFAGVTASPSAIMVQGFHENEALNELRDALRQQLRLNGLAEGVDGRYRLEIAHMTVARFRAPLRNSEQLATFLSCTRHQPFGATEIKSLSLVKNDWYMTHRVLEMVKRYRLCQKTS